jgi:hypothetical protein
LCKELHIPPRGGGLLDQPAHELVLLEKVFEAQDKDRARKEEREKVRQKSLGKSGSVE